MLYIWGVKSSRIEELKRQLSGTKAAVEGINEKIRAAQSEHRGESIFVQHEDKKTRERALKKLNLKLKKLEHEREMSK